MATPKRFPLAVSSSNALGLDLYCRYTSANPTDNLFFSPLGLTVALSMTMAGARDTTADQLIRTMHIKRDVFQTQKDMVDLFGYLRTDIPDLHVATGVFARQGYRPSFEYSEKARRCYGAVMREVDFVENSEMVRRSINSWVADNTNGQVAEILTAGAVASPTRVCLVNGVEYNAVWPSPFSSSDMRHHLFHTSAAEFSPGFVTPEEVDVAVEMMSRIDTYGYVVNKDLSYAAVEILHKGEKTSLVVIMPDQRHDLRVLEDRKHLEALLDVTAGMTKTPDIELCIPRLKLDFGLNLSETLYYMGLTDLFTDYANLSGMFDTRPGAAYVTDFYHHVVADTSNEEEHEQSAPVSASAPGSPASGMQSPKGSIMRKKGARKRRASAVRTTLPFIVNRPFIFFVLHRELQLVLYMGTIKRIA